MSIVDSVRKDRRLAGRYRLAERIGVGGMAEVWRGEDEVLARPVAVKLIDPELLADPAFRGRFRAEARAAAALSHPHVVIVHDYGDEDGTPYIVMELLDGETLADRLARGPLPPAEAAAVGAQTAAALAAAHEAGLVHRDVKPANVFLTRDGVKVLDFGVAVRGETGPALGTPAYLAPEQVARGPVSPAADIFALGVVLFEALAGRRPFDEDDPRTDPPPFPAGVPAGIAELGERCLAADPAARPAAAEVAAALGALASPPAPGAPLAPEAPPGPGAPPPAPPTAGPPAAAPPPVARPRTSVLTDPAGQGRRRLLTAAGAAAVIVLAVAFLVAGRGPGREPAAAPGTTRTAAPPRSAAPQVTQPAVPTAAAGRAPAAALAALTRMRRTVDEGAATGQV
ncbi:MAG TPA: serine/threonine-protein kinase, partial [Streptosporangiaceae bacterium]